MSTHVAADTLAVLGGPPAVTLDDAEAARWPIVGAEEHAAVQEALATGEWSTSPIPQLLEAEFAAYHGVRHALSTANGTAALHAAFFGLGVGPGDEVISPAATYWATAMGSGPLLGTLVHLCSLEGLSFGTRDVRGSASS
jgi:hypothetical protein